jgi:hypothetical protein
VRALVLAFVGGAVASGVLVYLAAKRTQADLTGEGAAMQASFEAAGRLTERQLQAQADQWAREIAAVGQAQITAATIATAQQVVVTQFGITDAFLTDVHNVQMVAANPWPAVAAAARRLV